MDEERCDTCRYSMPNPYRGDYICNILLPVWVGDPIQKARHVEGYNSCDLWKGKE